MAAEQVESCEVWKGAGNCYQVDTECKFWIQRSTSTAKAAASQLICRNAQSPASDIIG